MLYHNIEILIVTTDCCHITQLLTAFRATVVNGRISAPACITCVDTSSIWEKLNAVRRCVHVWDDRVGRLVSLCVCVCVLLMCIVCVSVYWMDSSIYLRTPISAALMVRSNSIAASRSAAKVTRGLAGRPAGIHTSVSVFNFAVNGHTPPPATASGFDVRSMPCQLL